MEKYSNKKYLFEIIISLPRILRLNHVVYGSFGLTQDSALFHCMYVCINEKNCPANNRLHKQKLNV